MSENENERGFTYLRTNQREGKPRTRGITEIRGPYYSCQKSRQVLHCLNS